MKKISNNYLSYLHLKQHDSYLLLKCCLPNSIFLEGYIEMLGYYYHYLMIHVVDYIFDGSSIFIQCNLGFVTSGVVENVEDIFDCIDFNTELAVVDIEVVDIVLDVVAANKVYFDNCVDYCEYVGFDLAVE